MCKGVQGLVFTSDINITWCKKKNNTTIPKQWNQCAVKCLLNTQSMMHVLRLCSSFTLRSCHKRRRAAHVPFILEIEKCKYIILFSSWHERDLFWYCDVMWCYFFFFFWCRESLDLIPIPAFWCSECICRRAHLVVSNLCVFVDFLFVHTPGSEWFDVSCLFCWFGGEAFPILYAPSILSQRIANKFEHQFPLSS